MVKAIAWDFDEMATLFNKWLSDKMPEKTNFWGVGVTS